MGIRGPIPDPNNATGRHGRPSRQPKTTSAADVTDSGAAPKGLSPAGRRLWRRLAKAPWITAADRGALERLVLIYEELARYAATIASEGAQVAGSKGQTVAHPLLAVIDRSRASADKLEIELGLTPLARQRMHLKLERAPARVAPADGQDARLRLVGSARDRFERPA